jgi:hypothetical protein
LSVPLFSAYGLTLDSELPLPELAPTNSTTADITLRLGHVPFSSEDPRVLYKAISPDEVIVHYHNVGAAIVQNRDTIILSPAKNADPLALRLFVLQQVLGVLLLQRGFLVLHASAAIVNGRAIAFAGSSGQGKSTIVAALSRLNCPVLADDVLAIDMSGDCPVALPGLLHLKLTSETRAAISPSVISEHAISGRADKQLCEVAAPVGVQPTSLAAIYFLEQSSALQLTRIPPARAAIELVRHTYGSSLLHAIGASASHFQQCAKLADIIPITRIGRPRDLSLVGQIAARIKQQLP